MHPYKFKALVTLGQPRDESLAEVRPGLPHRMVVRGQHQQTHSSKFFSALVMNNGEGPPSQPDGSVMLTVALAGDDAREYFDIGASFSLWLGNDIGRGVVTRRMFV